MTKILGILNITEDSFSDGGKFLEPKAAIAHAKSLVKDGADIIDVGAASSHPDAADVSVADEIARLESVWKDLQKLKVPLSVDSFQPEVQLWAIKNGAQWLNDVSGFANPDIYKAIAASDVRLILMQALRGKGVAQAKDVAPEDLYEHSLEFFDSRLRPMTQAGIKANRVVLDPGMGFFLSDKPESSVVMLHLVDIIRKRFALEVMVGVSRKSFLQTIAKTDAAGTDTISFATEFYAVCKGVDFIRTHNPKPLKQALPIYDALRGGARAILESMAPPAPEAEAAPEVESK
ncbi:MAG: dihydropteroate synthase [Alphaproteobacteria bacterium]|nr:dihydropteroate synthase [Alphaproteobacteria bacterium]